MARLTKQERWKNKHTVFVKEFNTIWGAVQDERRQAIRDRRFYSITGAQWEDQLSEQFDGLPRFEINKIHQAVIRTMSEYRSNRISVRFRPGDTKSNDDTADTLTGRYRADEQRSDAQEAYDNAFEEAVGGGMGAFRFRVVDEDDEESNDDEPGTLRCDIEPIFDADSSVFFNLGAKKFTKADAERCYVITAYPKDEYEERWGDKFSMTSWQLPRDSVYFDWCTPAVVYVAEVYEVETVPLIYHIWQQAVTGEELKLTDEDLESETPDDGERTREDDLRDTGYTHVRDEKAQRRRVRKWQMNGSEIMADNGYVPGKYIPVVPTYGKRWFVDNVERFMGQVRLATDAQRLLNMMVSRLAELNTLTPYEIPIFLAEQIAGHMTEWAEGNLKRTPFRTIEPVLNADGSKQPAGPVAFVKPPDVPPAMAALFQAMAGAITDLTGGSLSEQDAMPTNVAQATIQTMQKRLDMQSYIYTDNMAKSMAHAGRVWLEIQKDIMPDDEHDAPVLQEDGTQEFAKMVTPGKGPNGEAITVNDPRVGRFDVYTDVGPSFSSRRDATVDALTQLLPSVVNDPQSLPVIIGAIIMNLEGEGLDDLRAYYRKKLVAAGAIKPTPDEEQEMAQQAANQKPDPQSEFLLAQADESNARAALARADSVKSGALAVKAIADAHKSDASTHNTNIETAFSVASAAQPQATPPAAPAPQPAGT